MRKIVVIFTCLIMLLSFGASLAGALSYGHEWYQRFTTARGEVVAIADSGIYRYSLRALVTRGHIVGCRLARGRHPCPPRRLRAVPQRIGARDGALRRQRVQTTDRIQN